MVLNFNPWFYKKGHGNADRVFSDLVGQGVRRVRYLIAEGDFWPHGHRDDEIHEVDMGVELTTTSGVRFVISWAMDGLVQGLGYQVLHENSGQSVGTTVDVSAMDQWRPLLGRPIGRVGLASHVAEDDCPATYWSLRIEFEESGSSVVALGEVDDELDYQPDSLVVLFDEETARSYRIISSGMSAWGELVCAR